MGAPSRPNCAGGGATDSGSWGVAGARGAAGGREGAEGWGEGVAGLAVASN